MGMYKTYGNDEYNQLAYLYPKYKINKPIRLIEFFGGYGTFSYALKYLGANYESYKLCEWALKSIKAYHNGHHKDDTTDYSKDLSREEIIDYLFNKGVSQDYNKPMTKEQISQLTDNKLREAYNSIQATHNLVNIQQVKGSDLEIVNKDKYEYVLTYSYPCVTNDSLILTKRGYIEMKDVTLDDVVLTKSNTWHKVAKKFDNGTHPTCYLYGMGFDSIHCTLNHKFYVRTMAKVWDNSKRKYVRTFSEPNFKETKDLVRGDYFGVPVIQDEIPFYSNDLSFWFLIGYYLGDGWLDKNSNQIRLACNDKKLEILKSRLNINKFNVSWNGTCWRFSFTDKEIYKFISKYIGTGCSEKVVSGEILTLPKDCLNALYEGYLSSDGCICKGKHQFSSVNKNLIYSLGIIINKLFNRPVSIYKNKTLDTCVIQDRVVNQKDWYQLRFNPLNNKQDKAFYEDGYIWYPFNKIELADFEHVYNMEIEEDHSYIIQGCISKNCQDLSLAGERKGMSDTSTRSGMLWEVERILNELYETNSLPQILIMENVQQVHDSCNKEDFDKWILHLEDLGYKNYYRDLQATDFGEPQLRTRCFMVSILGENSFVFPDPITNQKDLNTNCLLETNVNDKFYLTDRLVAWMKRTNYHQSSFDFCKLKRISNTLTTSVHFFLQDKTNTTQTSNEGFYRYITPKESFRLMGIKDSDFNNIAIDQSDTSLWHLAGDAICVVVPIAIFGELLEINYKDMLKNWCNNVKDSE